MQDPSSPRYHQWLNPEQFGERFGASVTDINRTAEWLRSEGFTVGSVARGRSWIVFSGTVAQAQNAFHTEIRRFQAGAKEHFAPAVPPSVPEEFASIIGAIRGLDDFYPEPSRKPQPMYTESNGMHLLAPGDLAEIYGISKVASGYGVTIAVVGNSAVNLADIEQFRSTFQLPANDPQTLLAGDNPGTNTSGGLLEADSDLEWVGAVAPQATILYAYATDVFVAAQTVIDQNLASILSFSFGACEPSLAQSDASSIQEPGSAGEQLKGSPGSPPPGRRGERPVAMRIRTPPLKGSPCGFQHLFPRSPQSAARSLTNRTACGAPAIPGTFPPFMGISPRSVGMTQPQPRGCAQAAAARASCIRNRCGRQGLEFPTTARGTSRI